MTGVIFSWSENRLVLKPCIFIEQEKHSYPCGVPNLKVLYAFFEAAILRIQCLKADAYLSKNTREYILENMLAPLEAGNKK
ncbi:MAG: hypothetical protein R3D58_18385 [Saprospiraceae bacterium]